MEQVIEKAKVDFDVSQFGLAKREEMERLYEETLKNFKKGAIVKGKIVAVLGNEVLVDIGYKSEGIIPVEEFRNIEDIKIGEEIEVVIEEFEDEEGRILLSKIKAEQQKMWDNVLANVNEGSVIEGEIKSKIKGGLIIDINGVKGFLPGSQIDVAPVKNLDELIGKRCEFKIIKIDRIRRNIVLSRRELIEQKRRDKRRELLSEIKIGQIRSGVVKNITDFGAFLDLGGLDGLLHITDMSWGRVGHPSKIMKVGDTLEVMILDIDFDKERVSLGLKQKTPNPWDNIEAKYPVGKRVRGKVVNLVPYGAFIEIEEGVEGLVHVSEMSWIQRVGKASDMLSIGQEVEAVVLSVSKEEQKISLGIRQTTENPWDRVKEKYPIGSKVKGVVKNFTTYGAFVELEDGIDGMIHVSDMSWTKKINHPSEVLKKGDTVEVVVLEVVPENQRISLGLKQTQEDPWATVALKYKIGQIVEGKVSKLTSFGAFISLDDGIDGLVHISQVSDQPVERIKDVLKVGQEVRARIVKIDPTERRIGLSIKAALLPDDQFELKEEMLTGLRPGEDIVDLAGAFDEAFGATGQKIQEWRPGEKNDSKSDKGTEKENSSSN